MTQSPEETSLVQESHILLRRGRWLYVEGRKGRHAHQPEALDQLNEATSETMAVGCPFCMTMMEDALKSRSLEDQMRVRDLSELIGESTGTPTK